MLKDLKHISGAILETSIAQVRSERPRLTRGGGRSLVAKLPPPKNRNKRERKDILTILTCGASPAEGRRGGATRDSSIRGRPNLVSCDGTAPFLRRNSHSCKLGKGRNHFQVVKESSGPPKSYLLKQTARKTAMNSFLFFSGILALDLPIIPAARRRGPPLRLSARMN